MFYTLDKKRMVKAGLEAPGSSDCVGIVTLTVTPEMIGQRVGLALVAEVKRPDWQKPTKDHEEDQARFIDVVNTFGGIGFFITDHNQLEEKIENILKERLDANQKRDSVVFDTI